MSGTRLDLLVQPFILFTNWRTDMDLKRPLTFLEQVEKLIEHSIIITDDEQKDQFRKDLFAILKKYDDVIDLSLIGFPQNYRNII